MGPLWIGVFCVSEHVTCQWNQSCCLLWGTDILAGKAWSLGLEQPKAFKGWTSFDGSQHCLWMPKKLKHVPEVISSSYHDHGTYFPTLEALSDSRKDICIFKSTFLQSVSHPSFSFIPQWPLTFFPSLQISFAWYRISCKCNQQSVLFCVWLLLLSIMTRIHLYHGLNSFILLYYLREDLVRI